MGREQLRHTSWPADVHSDHAKTSNIAHARNAHARTSGSRCALAITFADAGLIVDTSLSPRPLPRCRGGNVCSRIALGLTKLRRHDGRVRANASASASSALCCALSNVTRFANSSNARSTIFSRCKRNPTDCRNGTLSVAIAIAVRSHAASGTWLSPPPPPPPSPPPCRADQHNANL